MDDQVWGKFHKLKQLWTTTLILWIVDPNGDFVVCTDASKEGIRGVLLHNGCVICYESWKLREHEHNYPTHDLELAAIIHALKMWRNYPMGNNLIMHMHWSFSSSHHRLREMIYNRSSLLQDISIVPWCNPYDISWSFSSLLFVHISNAKSPRTVDPTSALISSVQKHMAHTILQHLPFSKPCALS